MARPKKEKQLVLTRHINLRLTKTQYEVISEASKQAGDFQGIRKIPDN